MRSYILYKEIRNVVKSNSDLMCFIRKNQENRFLGYIAKIQVEKKGMENCLDF